MNRLLKDKDAVLFDMDGTLMDSMWIWKDIDIEYLGRHNMDMPEDLQQNIEGMGFYETAVYFKEHFHIPDEVDSIVQEWNEMAMEKYRTQVHLKKGALSFLQVLKERGIRTGIATSNTPELTHVVLKSNHVEELFDCVCCVDKSIKGKPAPDVYLLVASKLGVESARCLVFEDIPMGIMAGKNAGMQVCAVADAYCKDRAEKVRELADWYIKDFTQIINGEYEVLQ